LRRSENKDKGQRIKDKVQSKKAKGKRKKLYGYAVMQKCSD
jgi:hypothetical protein